MDTTTLSSEIALRVDDVLVNIHEEALDLLLSNMEQDGKDVVLKPELSQQIALFKKTQVRMKEVEDTLKAAIMTALGSYEAKSLKGQFTTISVSKPKGRYAYKLEDGFKQKWGKQETKYVPDVDAIEAYIEEHGEIPEGVTRTETQPSVSIRLKG